MTVREVSEYCVYIRFTITDWVHSKQIPGFGGSDAFK